MPDVRRETARVEPKMISFHGDDGRSRGEEQEVMVVINERRKRWEREMMA